MRKCTLSVKEFDALRHSLYTYDDRNTDTRAAEAEVRCRDGVGLDWGWLYQECVHIPEYVRSLRDVNSYSMDCQDYRKNTLMPFIEI